MIRPVFANTAWLRTPERLIMRGGRLRRVRLRVRVGLIEHPIHGPVLIDAGYGPQAIEGTRRSLALRLYARLLRFQLNPLESPLALLADHGYLPEDVKLVLVTHLHADHVCYLPDLPNTCFVVDGHMQGKVANGVFNELLPDDFAARCHMLRDCKMAPLPFGMGDGFDIFGDGQVLGVPLPGHAQGHYGLCFPGDRPLLYATDAQWLLPAIMQDRHPGFPANLVADDKAQLVSSMALARRFAEAGGDLMLCHDTDATQYDWSPSNV